MAISAPNGHELLELWKKAGIVGMWADRTDIGDTLEFARDLRETVWQRKQRGERID